MCGVLLHHPAEPEVTELGHHAQRAGAGASYQHIASILQAAKHPQHSRTAATAVMK
jgi:hypothetical protein